MKCSRFIAALGLSALLIVPLGGGAAQAQAADWDIPGGHFYTQASGQAGPSAGYAVVDDGSAPFWSEFQRLGGVDGVGYPISQRFVWDGFISQAFQKGVFQWRLEAGQVYFVNVFDQMSQAGKDDFLLTVRQVPAIADWRADTGRSWEDIVAAHQALLGANPAISAAYFAVADPINLYGLPMAPIADMGNVLVLRAQRVVIQQWKEDVPWAAAGQVTVANGGDVAKEAGLLPAVAILPVPSTPGAGAPPATAPTSPPATPPSAGPAPTTPAQPNVNPRALQLTASLDNPNPPSPGSVTLRVLVTDEVGQPVPGAAVAVIVRFPEGEFANFTPNTDQRGQSSLVIPIPAGIAGQSIQIDLTAIFALLGTTQQLSFTPR